MTVTIDDSFTLKCQHVVDDAALVAVDWDEWEYEGATKKRKVYGAKGLWTFNLVENAVSWLDSAAKYLQDKCKSGDYVILEVNEGARFSIERMKCYVLKCQTAFALTGLVNVHHMTVVLREIATTNE